MRSFKGGAQPGTIEESVGDYIARGMTLEQAIKKVEDVLRCDLGRQCPEILYSIRQKYS